MTCAQVRRGARDGAAVAVHPDERERARRAREVMRAVRLNQLAAGGSGVDLVWIP
jgi:histidine ammonia-lyase